MSDPFIGEVKFTAFNFAPRGYAACNGQSLPINQNQALFSIIGVTYGGDGVNTFLLPNLQGRVPMHWGSSSPLPGSAQLSYGQNGGETNHTLTTAEMASHNHTLTASSAGVTQKAATGNFLASSNPNAYATSSNTAMIGTEVSFNPGGQGHNNMQPFQVLNAVIALQGIFPPRN